MQEGFFDMCILLYTCTYYTQQKIIGLFPKSHSVIRDPPPKTLTCCHDLVMYNNTFSELNRFVFSSIHLMKTNAFNNKQKHFLYKSLTLLQVTQFNFRKL